MLDTHYQDCLITALENVPLTLEQIDIVYPQLAKTIGYLASKKDLSEHGHLWNFSEKVDESVKLLGTTRERYIQAGLVRPSLFYQSPATINRNIDEGARLIGISRERYLEAAFERPQLFTMSPEKLHLKIQSLRRTHRHGWIKSDNLGEDIANNPVILTYGVTNMELHAVHAQIHGKSYKLNSFLKSGGCKSRANIEQEVVRYYTDIFNEVGKGAFIMRSLVRKGIIATLPDWAAPAVA